MKKKINILNLEDCRRLLEISLNINPFLSSLYKNYINKIELENLKVGIVLKKAFFYEPIFCNFKIAKSFPIDFKIPNIIDEKELKFDEKIISRRLRTPIWVSNVLESLHYLISLEKESFFVNYPRWKDLIIDIKQNDPLFPIHVCIQNFINSINIEKKRKRKNPVNYKLEYCRSKKFKKIKKD